MKNFIGKTAILSTIHHGTELTVVGVVTDLLDQLLGSGFGGHHAGWNQALRGELFGGSPGMKRGAPPFHEQFLGFITG